MTFELPLVGDKVKPHQVIALHLMTASVYTAAGAVLYWLNPPTKMWGVAMMICGVALLLLSVFRSRWLRKDKINFIFRIYELAVAIGMTSLSFMQQWMPAVIIFSILSVTLFFALIWEKDRESSLMVKVSEEGIALPFTSRKKFLKWWETEQVLLRYGTLTIDSSENKLYQWTVAQIDFDHAEFEDYCRRQIETGKQNQPRNNW